MQKFPALFPNGASPRACLLTSILDELFESFEIAFYPARNYPERVAGFFDETFRVIDYYPVLKDRPRGKQQNLKS